MSNEATAQVASSDTTLQTALTILGHRQQYLRRINLDLQAMRNADMAAMAAAWAGMTEEDKAALQGEQFLAQWNAKRAFHARAISLSNASIMQTMTEYARVRQILVERGVLLV